MTPQDVGHDGCCMHGPVAPACGNRPCSLRFMCPPGGPEGKQGVRMCLCWDWRRVQAGKRGRQRLQHRSTPWWLLDVCYPTCWQSLSVCGVQRMPARWSSSGGLGCASTQHAFQTFPVNPSNTAHGVGGCTLPLAARSWHGSQPPTRLRPGVGGSSGGVM